MTAFPSFNIFLNVSNFLAERELLVEIIHFFSSVAIPFLFEAGWLGLKSTKLVCDEF